MSPMVNSSNFKNNVNKPGKRKVHPVVPLLFVMILASLLILISSFVASFFRKTTIDILNFLRFLGIISLL